VDPRVKPEDDTKEGEQACAPGHGTRPARPVKSRQNTGEEQSVSIADIPSEPDRSRWRSVADQLRAHAEASPDKPFVEAIDRGTAITYGEMSQLSNRMARFLAARGVGAGGRIAVLTDNRLEMPALYFAIQRYGAAFCTINVEVNASHVREMLGRMQPELVLYHEDLDAAALGHGEHADWIPFGDCVPGGEASDGGLFEALNAYSDADVPDDPAPDAGAGPDDLCVLSFTSGTSAAPKGVMHRFGNYFWIADQTIDMWKLTGADRLLEFRSLSWASSHMLCLMPALRVGATILLADRFSRSRFFGWLRDFSPTMVIGVPTVINMLLEHDASAGDVSATRALRFMSSSTAPLMVEQHKRFEETYGVELVQLYGMSEGGIVASNHVGARRIGSVGRPGLYQNLRIVGPDGEPLPDGETGEIEIGGAQPASGYLLADGSVEPIGRLKTGDLGFLDPDGFLIVTGRARDVIIRGGVNIAPLEIDNALAAHPDVREAATIGVPDRVYGEEPVGFVSLKTGSTADNRAILDHCAAALSDFKRPKRIVVLEDIPKNERGKIDRNALAALWERDYSSA
jgi:acyl-coenzyme A synthetase/AMP-(fatty) acid ligase